MICISNWSLQYYCLAWLHPNQLIWISYFLEQLQFFQIQFLICFLLFIFTINYNTLRKFLSLLIYFTIIFENIFQNTFFIFFFRVSNLCTFTNSLLCICFSCESSLNIKILLLLLYGIFKINWNFIGIKSYLYFC